MSAPVCPATPERAVLLGVLATTMRRIDVALDRRDRATFVALVKYRADLLTRLST